MEETHSINESEIDRDAMLIELIETLTSPDNCVSEENVTEWINKLKSIYLDETSPEGVYRHSYARLSAYLYDKVQTTDDNEPITVVLEKLKFILNKTDELALQKPIRKLCDHIDLEGIHISQLQRITTLSTSLVQITDRYSHVEQELIVAEQEIKKYSNDLVSLKSDYEDLFQDHTKGVQEINDASKKVEDIQEKLRNSETQTVAILGIFAGVVFAFSGGFSMLGSVFSNIHQVSDSQSWLYIAIVAICGLVLYDVVYALLHFISLILTKDSKILNPFSMWLNIVGSIIIIISLLLYAELPAYISNAIEAASPTATIPFCTESNNTSATLNPSPTPSTSTLPHNIQSSS